MKLFFVDQVNLRFLSESRLKPAIFNKVRQLNHWNLHHHMEFRKFMSEG